MRAPSARSIAAAEQRLDALVAETPRAARGGSAVAAGLAFVGGFAVTCLLVSLALRAAPAGSPFDRGSLSSLKRTAFSEHKDEFDLVFVGTSRVRRQFDPWLFDERLAAAGFPLQSFDFGVRGMRYPESCETVQWILDQKPARLKWLFIDLTGELVRVPRSRNNSRDEPELPLHEENAYTRRAIHFHDGARTRLLCHAVLVSDLSIGKKLDALRVHLHHWSLRFARVGYVTRAIRRWAVPEPIERDWLQARPPDGGDKTASGRTRRAILDGVESFVEDRAPDPTDQLWWSDLGRVVRTARAQGVEPVLVVVPPHWYDDVAGFDPGRIAGTPSVLDYRSPADFPQFFEPRHLFNYNHLNDAGSALFLDLLVADFVRLLEQDGPPRDE